MPGTDRTSELPDFDNRDIVELRPQLSRPSPQLRPLGVELEAEPIDKFGETCLAGTIFLVGSECRFRCTMCDLWQYTHPGPTPPGALAQQITHGLKQLDESLGTKSLATSAAQPSIPLRCIKLYNASNFFATTNVPASDLPNIADRVAHFDRVVVENHPTILLPAITDFKERLNGRLEVALGLETAHPKLLEKLNKAMSLNDFRIACDWLLARDIDVRVFVLLQPPGLDGNSAIDWCLESIRVAEKSGARQVSVIPVRRGNGAIDKLQQNGLFKQPTARSLEVVMQNVDAFRCIVTADLWDWQHIRGTCDACSQARKHLLEKTNLTQSPPQLKDCLQCNDQ
ncbi:MAG TPA: radical SAM protein [Planctomycetaceae bacterium]|nr:radical SAM protein [Planctomycetaceae bacterium]